MMKLIVGALLAFAIPAVSAEWYIIAPIAAAGHPHPFVVYNEEPYADQDACFEALAGEEFWKVFTDWQEYELMEHKGDATFGKPTCIIYVPGDPA